MSEIAHAPPHVREIWDLFLCRACYSDNDILQRGQLRITYDDIREILHWMVGWRKMRYSKWHCEKALKWLRKATMITTTKTTRGMIITIVNYAIYQNPTNYESHRKATKKITGKPQTTDTIYKNKKNGKNENNSFAHFWEIYPRKTGKLKALQSWNKINPDDQLLERIYFAVIEQSKSEQWRDPQYIPYPATWLNQGRWDDVPPETREQCIDRETKEKIERIKADEQCRSN